MMNASNRILMVALAVAMTGAMGCGDDDRPAGTDSGTGGTDTGTGGADTGTGDMCTFAPTTMDGCTDAADVAAAMADNLGPDMNESLADIARRRGTQCALAGMSGDALTNCVRDALLEETSDGVSSGCASCYGASVTCSAAHCIGVCIDGGDDCDACRCGMNTAMCSCGEVFTQCSGLPNSCP